MRFFFWKNIQPRLEAIFIAPAAGQDMLSVLSAQALVGQGLDGDRYASNKGFWVAMEACELTLITVNDIKKVRKKLDRKGQEALDRGSHRRNLLLSGIPAKKLLNKRFRIGGAEFCFHKYRPPCGYIDQVSGKGMCKALGRNSGICIKVLKSGRIAVQDELEWLI